MRSPARSERRATGCRKPLRGPSLRILFLSRVVGVIMPRHFSLKANEMLRIARAIATIAMFWCAAISVGAHAQAVPFACPKAGTTVNLPDGRVLTYQGADARDPLVCVVSDSGSQVGPKLLYNYYSPDSDTADVRAGMRDLFAGQSKVAFTYTTVRGSYAVTWNHTWTRQGAATVDIAGRKVDTVIFELEARAPTGTFHAKYRRYFAPAVGVWVRNEVTNLGSALFPALSNTTYQVTSITIPQ